MVNMVFWFLYTILDPILSHELTVISNLIINHYVPLYPIIALLVGGWAYPSEKYDFVSWDDDIPNIWNGKKKSCLKPPTSNLLAMEYVEYMNVI